MAAAVAWLPAGSAQANVAATYQASGNSFVDYTGTDPAGDCLLTPGDNASPTSSEKQFRDGTRRASVSLDTHYTNSVDSTDTAHVKGHLDTKLTVDKRHRDLKSFELGAGGSLKIIHSVLNSDCTASGSVVGVADITFTEHHKGWFYLTRDTGKPNSEVFFVLENAKNGNVKTLDIFVGDKSHATSRALLRPGKYRLVELAAGLTLNESGGFLKSGGTRDRAVSLTTTVQGEFKRKK